MNEKGHGSQDGRNDHYPEAPSIGKNTSGGRAPHAETDYFGQDACQCLLRGRRRHPCPVALEKLKPFSTKLCWTAVR